MHISTNKQMPALCSYTEYSHLYWIFSCCYRDFWHWFCLHKLSISTSSLVKCTSICTSFLKCTPFYRKVVCSNIYCQTVQYTQIHGKQNWTYLLDLYQSSKHLPAIVYFNLLLSHPRDLQVFQSSLHCQHVWEMHNF